MIMEDIDGLISIDYLGKAFREMGDPKNESKESVGNGLDFAGKEYERFRQLGDSKHTLRYDRLLQYMSSRKHLWE